MAEIRECVGCGGKCACCGEATEEFLTLDHVNGKGSEHARKVGGSDGIYRETLREGCPKNKYRVLCWNCNCTLGYCKYCPHNGRPKVEDIDRKKIKRLG